MPTNDERREVAENLRNMCICGCRYKEEFYDLLVETVMRAWDFHEFSDVADRLADLIEPEERTCERGIEMFSHAYPNEIVCDSDCVSTYVFPLTCGHEVELLENKWPSYCPHCGARVVADA